MTVSLDQAKRYLRVAGDDHDATIDDMLDRAIQMASDYVGFDLGLLSSSSSESVTDSARMGILILLEMQWSTPPDKRQLMRDLAHEALAPAVSWWAT